jgi:hypothetical protein
VITWSTWLAGAAARATRPPDSCEREARPSSAFVDRENELAALHRAAPTLHGEIDAGTMIATALDDAETVNFCRDRQRHGLPIIWRT